MFIKSGLWSLYTCLFFFFSWPLEVALFSKLASLTMTRKPKHNVQQFVILLYRVILPFDVKPFFCQQALMFWGTICSVFVSFVSIEGGQTVSGGDPADWENAKRLWPWGSLCWILCRHYSGISPLWCVCLSPIWLENFWTWPACIRILDLDAVSNMGRNWKKKYIYIVGEDQYLNPDQLMNRFLQNSSLLVGLGPRNECCIFLMRSGFWSWIRKLEFTRILRTFQLLTAVVVFRIFIQVNSWQEALVMFSSSALCNSVVFSL